LRKTRFSACNPDPDALPKSNIQEVIPMTGDAPGKFYRKGLTLIQIADMFGDEAKAHAWIEAER